MKKILFLLVTALVSATMSFAQSTLVATLSHGSDISMFYGSSALSNAMNAAVSGDVINLSGGVFSGVNITKGVTLRGTGINDATPTYISGNFTINVPTDDTNRLSMEGIRCTGNITMEGTFDNPYFVKCAFYGFSYGSNADIKNAMFANCRISQGFTLAGTSTAQFINCFVGSFNNYYSYSQYTGNTEATFMNCVIKPREVYPSSNHYLAIQKSQLLNCIVYHKHNDSLSSIEDYTKSLLGSNMAINCVSIGISSAFSKNATNKGNSIVNYDDISKVFKNFNGTYSDAETFELTDEAKTKYLGTDGTEVGLYGGALPYNTTPSYPQITKMNVANKTTADGKLSVEIAVSAAQ